MFDDEDDDHNNNTGSGGSGGLDDNDMSGQIGHQLQNGLVLDEMGVSSGGGNAADGGLTSSGGGWCAEDMLLTNQTKYGYKSTYNSDLSEYTLPVEKENTEEYKRREEEAEKLANEIESSSQYRKNVDKELSDNEEEEEAFSAVIRSPNSNTGEINNNNTNSSNNNNSKFFVIYYYFSLSFKSS